MLIQIQHRNSYLLFFCLLLLLSACKQQQTEPPAEPARQVVTLEPVSHQELDSYFSRHGYNWQTLNLGVPLIIVEKFPVDFQELEAGNERKRLFFLALLPMVLLVNDEISEQRTTLSELCRRFDQQEILSPLELNNIAELAKCYKVERDPLSDAQARTLLFNRLDILPPSLVLAQAANESAYGTSRFARLGNNLFGEMVFDDPRIAGIIPLYNRKDGVPAYRARSFPTLLESLRAYMINLNTHSAYQDLRIRRAELRAKGLTIAGRELADGLLAYSERGDAYIRDIKTVIAVNRLSLLSDVALRKPAPLVEGSTPSSAQP